MTYLTEESTSYSADMLCAKMLKENSGALKKHKLYNKKGIVIYSAQLSQEMAIRLAYADDNSLQEVALYLRSKVKRMLNEDMSDEFTANTIDAGQGKPPDELLTFFRVLYTGSADVSQNDKVERLVHSISDDVVFATTSGRIKPGKHLTLGL
jgi:hypothetical protein